MIEISSIVNRFVRMIIVLRPQKNTNVFRHRLGRFISSSKAWRASFQPSDSLSPRLRWLDELGTHFGWLGKSSCSFPLFSQTFFRLYLTVAIVQTF